MIRQLRTVWCDGIPTKGDLISAMSLLQQWGTFVELKWNVPHNGQHSLVITDKDTVEDLWAKLPRYYPV